MYTILTRSLFDFAFSVVYLIFSMGVTCISVVIQVVVLFAHHNKKPSRPPRLLRLLATKVYPNNQVAPENYATENGNYTRKTDASPKRPATRTTRTEGFDSELIAKVQLIVNELDIYRQRYEEDKTQQGINMEWQLVSTAIDYVCFWVLIGWVGLGAIVTLLIMPAIQ
jgi:hypothetical protein